MADRKIFLSYASKDKSWVQEFAQKLQQYHLDAWFDDSHLEPGKPWIEQLQKELARSSAVLLLFYDPAPTEWQYFEAGAARALGKDVFAIAPKEFDRSRLPHDIRWTEWISRGTPEATAKAVADAVSSRDEA